MDFGIRRELKLVDFKGDRESLLLVFNQPLGEPDALDHSPPFSPTFYPRLRVRSVEREGAAGVRVVFEEKLPPARTYTATVPSGWRAATGATLLNSARVEWETDRPELLEVRAERDLESHTAGRGLRLVFNQPIEPRSVLERLHVSDGSSKTVSRASSARLQKQDNSPHEYLLVLPGLKLDERVKLTLREGVRPAQGRLEGRASKTFALGPEMERGLSYSPPRSGQRSSPSALPEVPILDYLRLSPGVTTLDIKVSGPLEVETWPLDEASLLALLLKKRGDSGVIAGIESASPIYSRRYHNEMDRFQWISPDFDGRTRRSLGAFWVRLRSGKGRVERKLIVHSRQEARAIALAQTVAVITAQKNAPATLYSETGKRLLDFVTSHDGATHLTWSGSARAALVVVRGPKGIEIGPVTTVAPPVSSAVPGVLWSERALCKPHGSFEFFGVWWGEEEMPKLALHDGSGARVGEIANLEWSGRLFRGTVRAPKDHGRYALGLEGGVSTLSALPVEITQFEGEASASDLVLSVDQSGRVSGTYSWSGPEARFLGLRAVRQMPSNGIDDQASEPRGVGRALPIEMEVKRTLGGGEFQLSEFPPLDGHSHLLVELYDVREPSRVYRSAYHESGERAEQTATSGARQAGSVPPPGGELPSLVRSLQRVKSGDVVRLSWPDSTPVDQAWTGLMVGNRVASLRFRSLAGSGDLGALSVPSLSPGVRSVTAFAVGFNAGEQPLLRMSELPVAEESEVAPLEVVINKTLDFQSCSKGERLVLELPKAAIDRALVLWDKRSHPPRPVQATPWSRFLQQDEGCGLAEQSTASHGSRGPFPVVEGRFETAAPGQAGNYLLRILVEQESKLAYFEREIEVVESARYGEISPRFVRPGDLFSAGIRLWADPRGQGSLVATASVDPNASLRPLSFYTTSALAKAQSTADLLFSYRAPESFAAHDRHSLTLRWEFGLQGSKQALEATVPFYFGSTAAERLRTRELASGSALKMRAPEGESRRVDLKLEAAPAAMDRVARVEVKVGSEPSRVLDLDRNHPAASVLQNGGGECQIRHLSGGRVQADLLRLRSAHAPQSGSRLYLMNYLENREGEPHNRERPLKVGERFRAVYSLVLPEKLPRARLVAPLPGGVKVVGCWVVDIEEHEPLEWFVQEDRLVIELPGWEAAEYKVIVLLEPIARGDYSWPPPTVRIEDGSVGASGRSGRLVLID